MAHLRHLSKAACHPGGHRQTHAHAGPGFNGRRRLRLGRYSGSWRRRRSRNTRSFRRCRCPGHLRSFHPRHLRRLRHSRQLGSFRHPGHLRRWRRLNHVPLPFHFVPFENALAQILHLHAGRRRRGGCSEMRTLGRLRQAGCLRRRWRRRLNRCRLLHVVQHDGLSGGGVRDHGQVAGIDARFSIRRAGESKCRLHRLSARLWRLNRARVFSRNRGSEIWRLWTHCLHRLPRAGCVGAAFPRSGL